MSAAKKKANAVSPNGKCVVGIDVGKKHHAAAGLTTFGQLFRRVRSFDNNRDGIDRLENVLLKPLGGPSKVLIGLEATGHYWMPLYFELKRRHYEQAVLNSIQTGKHSRALIRKAKTDPLDALGIARLLFGGQAQAARIPSESVFELRMLCRHRWRLMDYAGDLRRFAHTLTDRLFPEFFGLFEDAFNVSSRAMIRTIGFSPDQLAAQPEQLHKLLRRTSRKRLSSEKIDELIKRASRSIGIRQGEAVLVEQLKSTLTLIETFEGQLIQLDQELQRRVEEIQSPLSSLGLRAPIVATIHAESDPISEFKQVKLYVAYTGIDPSIWQSGGKTGTRSRISKRGSTYLRHSLYLAASVLYHKHKELGRLYKKSRAGGHHHNAALMIVAHKLARIIWRLLTDNRPFKKRAPKKGV